MKTVWCTRYATFTAEEFHARLIEEAEHLDWLLEDKFPGYKTTADGVEIDTAIAVETNRRLGFPP